ncbi:DUF6231 family protein [Guyparkeria sp. SCN-R1]|uniref:DUF6231 family protein n=1 Tax=Guyparkeria sp. SCN-R1 TaxID=2341113 RepID=UPI000F64DF40|nr:DUF6231 family protein [Guyparkeria sp. SCN-R1]
MNAKKTPELYVHRLSEKDRHERLEADNRLIACEKVNGGMAGITLVVTAHDGQGSSRQAARRLPTDQEAILDEIRGREGAVEILVDSVTWSGTLGGLLAALRDRANRRIIVHLGDGRVGGPDDRQMVALGYRRLKTETPLYEFNIESYKDTPDWLNSRNWANPELWGKYRW